MVDKIVAKHLSSSYEGEMYLHLRQRNGQKMFELEKSVREIISNNNLTVTQAKGFLEYMKFVIDGCSYLPK